MVWGVVLAAFAREAVGGHELRRHQAHGVTELSNSRAQWWAPEQAYMPIRQGGKDAMSSSNLARGTLGPSSAGLPASSTTCTAKTFFAKSCQMDANGYDIHKTSFCKYKRVDEKYDLSIVALSCR